MRMDVDADATRRTSVFIVGGGPVGLAMGLLLDRFGIDAVIVEKSPTTTDHPKSRGCWVRTMEIFRQWGIEQAIRDRGLQDNSNLVQVRFSTEFLGFEETEDGVVCEIRDVASGRTERWQARYLLACDGAG